MNIKKILAAIIVSAAVITSIPVIVPDNGNITMNASAADYTEGKQSYFTYRKYIDHVEIIKCDTSASGNITIPNKINNTYVTIIESKAFENCNKLTGIKIPDSVRKIKSYAFRGCSSVTSFVIPNSVIELTGGVFYNCTSARTITLSDKIDYISSQTFYHCDSLTDIVIPKYVTSIAGDAFIYCGELTNVTLPPRLFFVGGRAFAFCPKIKKLVFYKDCSFSGSESCGFDNFTGVICGYENSTAQQFAQKYGYNFQVITEPAPQLEMTMGDVDLDGRINASDASLILSQYSARSTGREDHINNTQLGFADVNYDGKIDSSDASLILKYYAYTLTGGTNKTLVTWAYENRYI